MVLINTFQKGLNMIKMLPSATLWPHATRLFDKCCIACSVHPSVEQQSRQNSAVTLCDTNTGDAELFPDFSDSWLTSKNSQY